MRIAIVNAHYSKILGGSEIQCHQICEELHARGVDVLYLAVGGIGQEAEEINYLVHAVERNAKSILSNCLEFKADIVYWRYNKNFLPQVVKGLAKAQIPLIFSVSHIHDLQPFAYKPIPGLGLFSRLKRRSKHFLKGLIFASAIKKVSGVICNNEDHLELITQDSKCYIPNSPFLESQPFMWPKPYVVWVGNIKAHKHPELFVDLAKALNHLNTDFLMVGSMQQASYTYLTNKEELPENFHYLGAKDVRATNGVIEGALMLVHTCEPEGFPNVFLQAWGFSKTTVSLYFDPGGILESRDIGFLSHTLEKMKEDVSSLISNENLRNELGRKAKTVIEDEFVKSKNVDKILKFCQDILDTSGPSWNY